MKEIGSVRVTALAMLAALLATLALLAACGSQEESAKPGAAKPAAAKQDAAKPDAAKAEPAKTGAAKKVNVYMYSEYIDPAIPGQFEKLTGQEVQIDVYEAAEDMLTKLQNAGGVSQYDVVVGPNYLIPVMAKLDLIKPLDASKLPNGANVDPMFVNPPYDPDNQYSLPYQWGTIGLIYRKDKAADLAPTWQTVFDPAKQPGPFVLMDEMRPMMSAALVALGKSINSREKADLQAACDLMLKAKESKLCLGMDGGVGGKNKVVAGEASVAVVYNGDAVKAMAEEPNVAFLVPDEGTMIWVDCMMVPAKAPNPEGGLAFMNYILDPKVGAQLSNFIHYATPNKAAMDDIKPEDKANAAIYPTAEQLKKMQYQEDLGKDTPMYDEVWTTIKSK